MTFFAKNAQNRSRYLVKAKTVCKTLPLLSIMYNDNSKPTTRQPNAQNRRGDHSRTVPKFYRWCTIALWAIGILALGYGLLRWRVKWLRVGSG